MIKLYQFPISHYSEKVRWALKYKRLPHKCVSVLPGLHAKKMQKLSGASSVPVLSDEGNNIGGSAAIISYLDDQYPRFSLTPEDPKDEQVSLELERWADDEIGPAVRTIAYSILTKHPDLLKKIMSYDGPWYTSFYMKKAIPKIIHALRKGYKIDETNVQQARATLLKSIEKLQHQFADESLLVGDTFSRADVAVAALWAPIFRPAGYGLAWPENIPDEYTQLESEFESVKPWLQRMYSRYR